MLFYSNYLCFRGSPDTPHRSPQEQYEFMKSHPEAQEQAQELRKKAIDYAIQHGWSHLK